MSVSAVRERGPTRIDRSKAASQCLRQGVRIQVNAQKAGALGYDADKWDSIDWKEARRKVRRLQLRIAKAVKENRLRKADCCRPFRPGNTGPWLRHRR
jgi:hypothetical protein